MIASRDKNPLIVEYRANKESREGFVGDNNVPDRILTEKYDAEVIDLSKGKERMSVQSDHTLTGI